jgi:4-diphosphocytidyl-2-C-methyl-D-erythritol kinase
MKGQGSPYIYKKVDIMQVLAPAKLNLTLEVEPPREDGYHPIASVIVPLELADEIHLELLEDRNIIIDVEMAIPQGVKIDGGPDNLAWQAARLLQEEAKLHGIQTPGVKIRLIKHIPVAAGLGGGSTDAATVFKACNELWELNFKERQLSELGRRLGADIPFCIGCKPALVEGVGEHCTVLFGVPPLPLVLLNPKQPLNTPDVYRRFDETTTHKLPGRHTTQMIRALQSGGIESVAKVMHNDLQDAAIDLFPQIEIMRQCLLEAGAIVSMVSGSGPTVFGLALDLGHAEKILEKAKQKGKEQGYSWWGWHGLSLVG